MLKKINPLRAAHCHRFANSPPFYFALRMSVFDYEDERYDLMVGPPGAEALVLLTQMRDEYGWHISPEF